MSEDGDVLRAVVRSTEDFQAFLTALGEGIGRIWVQELYNRPPSIRSQLSLLKIFHPIPGLPTTGAADASRAVAARLGFPAEGIRRESHWITDRFFDHVVLGLRLVLVMAAGQGRRGRQEQ